MTENSSDNNPDDKKAAYNELKLLILGDEQQSLEEIRHHIFNKKQRSEDIAEVLSDSVTTASKDPERLSNSMSTVIHGSISKLIKTDPQSFADALFPVMGPAIRKSINETLKSFIQSLNQVLEQNTSAQGLKWRFESWRTGIPYAELVLKHTLVYRVDEVFLIQPGSGLLISHVAHPEAATQDSDAVSAMLSAIQDFVRDSFADDKQSGLDTVELGEHTLWVISGPSAILACAIRGIAPPSFRSKLQETLELLHINNKDLIETFDGDRKGMEVLEEPLQKCLEEQRATENKESEKKPFLSPPLVVILIIIFCIIFYFSWRSMDYENRLNLLKSDLNARQGVILYESTKIDNGIQLELLIDPLADSIDDLPVKYNFSSEDIVFKKTAYQSLEPDMAVRRAVKILQPPDTVKFQEKEQSLFMSGVAPIHWIKSSKNLFHVIPGFNGFNLDGLSPDYSAIVELARTQLQIPDSVMVSFDGSTLSLNGLAPAPWLLKLYNQNFSIKQVNQIDSSKLDVDEKSLLNWIKEQLEIPTSVTYTISDGRLNLAGEATNKWINSISLNNLDGPWINSIDARSLVNLEYQEFDYLFKAVSSQSIYFSDGIETVTGTELILSDLVDKIKRLIKLSSMLDKSININIVGYVDGLGTYQKNEKLALTRANWAKQKLQAQGIDETLVYPKTGEIVLSDNMNIGKRRVDFIIRVQDKQ